jgi:hypothetical protein
MKTHIQLVTEKIARATAEEIKKTSGLQADPYEDGAIWVGNNKLSVMFFPRDDNKKRLYFCVNTETYRDIDVTIENSSIPVSVSESSSDIAKLMIRTFRDMSRKHKNHIGAIARERKNLEKIYYMIWPISDPGSCTIANLRSNLRQYVQALDRALRVTRGGKGKLVFSN